MFNRSQCVSATATFLVMLFLALPILGIATSGVNAVPEELEPPAEPLYTHSSSSMNEPGFQSGSIFTNVALSTGFYHTCAIVPNSSVSSLQCWGNPGGYGGSSGSSTPVSVSLPSGNSPVYVSSGDEHTCIINNIGEVECIGSNSYGQGSHNWSQIASFNTAVSITSGDRHTCAILDNASIWCWGDNSLGELGFGTTTGTNEPAAFVNLPTGKTAVAAAAGRDFTCSILQDGSAYCWGENTRGQIGDGTTTNRNSPTQVSLPSGRLASALVTGQSHTCALLDNGSLWCWGHNVYGQLGDGTNCPAFNTNNGCNGNEGKNSPSQVLLPAGRTAISVSAGARHTCAILDNGSAMCWGQGGSGTLGAGLSTGFGHKQSTPVYVNLPTGQNATSIDVFGYHACATLEDNSSAMCWGLNNYGQLGDGSTVDKNSPSYVNFAPSAHVIMSNRDIDGDGVLNIFDTHMPGGQEGSIYSDTQLSAGEEHTCAIIDGGYLHCWGRNTDGQLGDNTTTQRNEPTNITLPNGLTAVSVDTGFRNTCAVASNGDLYCWGNNGEGQIGDGTATNRLSPTLVSLPSGRTATQVAVGGEHACAILDNGLPMCWGKDSHGQLGDGSPYQSKVTPVYVVWPNGATSALSITAGDYHTCMVVDTTNWASNPGPKAYCWGSKSNGKVGNGQTTGSSASPQWVKDGTSTNQPLNARIITTHSQHTCAIAGTPHGDSLQNSTESIFCWGYNGHGQLGNGNHGSPFSTSTPVSVSIPAGRTVVTISIGYELSCATLDNGSAVCWGGVPTWSSVVGFTPSTTPTFVNLSSNQHASSVTTGRNYFCIMLNNGSAMCAGNNDYGNIGDGTTTDKTSPVFIDFTSGQSLALGDTDSDGDGTVDWLDDYLDNPVRSVKCSEGSYGRYVCVEASAGHYVGSSGSMSQTECTVGTYQPSTGQSSCLDASTGHYVSSAGATSQIACPAGTYNPSTGGNSSAACLTTPAGFYSGAGTGSPTPCDAGTYQPNSGSTSEACLDASAGYYVAPTGVIYAGYHHTCAIDHLGELYCWGANENGILGQNDSGEASDQDALHNSNTPLNVPFGPGRTAVSVSMGYSHTCAILDDGSVNCWGQGQHTGTGSGSYIPIDTPLGTGRTAIAIDSGQAHTCAILDDGSLKCWGYNNNGQIANNSAVYYNGNPVDVYLGAGRTAVNISLGDYHTCVILDDSSLKCWGENIYGQLGDGTTTDTCTDDYDDQGNALFTCENNASTASAIDLGTGRYAVAVSAGKQHTCAILDDGTMKCWGANGNGKLGDGTNTQRLTPVAVSFSASYTISKISTGGSHTCAITSDESLYCWGYEDYIGVGDYACEDQSTGANDLCYTPVWLNLSAKAVNLGNVHTCAILDDANFWCWGGNSEYQLGTSNSSSDENYIAYLPEQTLMPTMAYGASSQTACPAGTYNPNTGSTTSAACLDTDAGYYTGSAGSASQTACAAGTYQPNTGQTSCLDTEAGYYVDSTGSTGQTLCAVGTYQPNTGQSSCLDAPAGTYVDYTGATSPTDCSAGTYQPNTGQTSCLDTEAGYYVASTGSTGQTPCTVGTYQNQTGQASCIDAPLGTFVNTTAATSPTDCAVGTFQNQTGQTSCIDAPSGTYVDTTGASSPTDCTGGTYQPSSGQTSCLDAEAGYYVGSTGASAQTPCSLGTYQPYTGQASCISASAGYYVDTTASTNQTACAAGTYQPNTGQTSCLDADAGYYVASTGSSNQTACASGTYQPSTGQTSCLDAPAGTYVDTMGATSPTDCSVGTYQPLTGQTSCLDASPGYYVATTASTTQIACGLGTYQPNSGQISCIDASPGNYVNTTASTNQTACDLGTYQPDSGQSSCLDAPAGTYVDTMGAISSTDCSIGSYQNQTGQISCIDADAGYHVPNTGSTNQTICPPGTYQPNTGQAFCIDASAGYYVPDSGALVQTPCALGTYQPLTGQTSCIDSDAGYYVDISGSASQYACDLGTYQNQTGQSNCLSAPAGHYVNTTAATEPVECLWGTFQPNEGQTSCIFAAPGHYVGTNGSAVQTPCPSGTYNPLSGSITLDDCIEAGIGHYVPLEGSSSQLECAAGTYQNITGQSSCNLADEGYYVPSAGSWFQVGCTAGTYQPSQGQISCHPASVGHYVPDHASPNQYECDLGSYQNQIGQSSCISASIGYYVNTTASTNQTACPPDFSTTSTGSDSILDCFIDTDGDNVPDIIDPDDDNDGYLDNNDDFPLDDTEWLDTDGDGIGNNADSDDDNDGWDDITEQACGSSDPLNASSVPDDNDDDGICDVQDPDDDNDSFNDVDDAFPFDPCAYLDTDGDGMPNWLLLNCVSNLVEDDDDDNDGYNDSNDTFPEDESEWIDTDGDGIGNNADTDDDGDTVPDAFDAFPLDWSEWFDTDSDGIGNNADTDDDNDGTLDGDDDFPLDSAADTDTDNDGLPDTLPSGYNGTLVEDLDDDGDGVLDVNDEFPLDSTEWVDTDGDGTGNNADADDDDDGWSDNDEFICGTSTTDANDVPPDSDGDGICDSEDDDSGGAGLIIKIVNENPALVLLTVAGIIILILTVQATRKKEDDTELLIDNVED